MALAVRASVELMLTSNGEAAGDLEFAATGTTPRVVGNLPTAGVLLLSPGGVVPEGVSVLSVNSDDTSFSVGVSL